MDERFQRSLQRGDVTDCYKIWCQYAEMHLKHLWQQMDVSEHFTSGRGVVRVDSHALWPSSKRDSAASLIARRLWKLICRMKEMQKKPFGHLAEKTWNSSRESLALFPSDIQAHLEPILRHPFYGFRHPVSEPVLLSIFWTLRC